MLKGTKTLGVLRSATVLRRIRSQQGQSFRVYHGRSAYTRDHIGNVHPSRALCAVNNNSNDGFDFGFGVLSLWVGLYFAASISSLERPSECESESTGEPPKSERVYRIDEVAKHVSKDVGVWVIYKDGVYDISGFIPNHPGGQDKIMLAAGGDIGPFWNLYRQHFNSTLPMELLRSMKIGSLHPEDVEKMKASQNPADSSDPYSLDPALSPVMRYHGRKPINAEAPGFLLTDSWITPTELWFVRNHHPVPAIDAKDCTMSVQFADAVLPHGSHGSTHTDGNDQPTLSFTVDQLRSIFKPHKVVSTLQCGGNRRAEMNSIAKTNGSPWCISAMSTAEWTGARLRDILLFAGVTEEDIYDSIVGGGCGGKIKHVIFVGHDDMQASIPVHKAMSMHGDALIAYEMNGSPIPPQHGAPLRAIIPGHVGVRNVKWVKEIRLSDEEATGPWQRGMSYKGFSPSTRSLEGIDVERIPSLQEQPVQSAITLPRADGPTAIASVNAGEPLTVQGYSYSGGGRGIVRVDVSIDGGKNWRTAELTQGSEQPLDRAWAWTLWECDFDIPEDMAGRKIEIVSKATDASYNVQPDSIEGIWNLRGINNNAWHRVKASVMQPEDDADSDE